MFIAYLIQFNCIKVYPSAESTEELLHNIYTSPVLLKELTNGNLDIISSKTLIEVPTRWLSHELL